jgi:hypothetical protein
LLLSGILLLRRAARIAAAARAFDAAALSVYKWDE